MALEIKNLHAEIQEDNGNKKILNGINLKLEKGKVYALMGPNGSGKTSLSNVLMGNPKYNLTEGEILINGENITGMAPDERAKKGLFLSFQNPTEISGVNFSDFLRSAYNSVSKEKKSLLEFNEMLKEKAKMLGVDEKFLERYLNEGFSGGEKKKSEILQMLVLAPKVAILDEVDSGTDVDALKAVADSINKLNQSTGMTILIITHYNRILKYLSPDKVFVMINGKITKERDGMDLANEIDESGYLGL